ncbi:MFS transporter [Allokutzneria albata]|uniref:Multidrug efflux pump Tap n=1 Tax=Allokutzneria albata TaxID=211114 RepID=A0A1G9U439_ALLAB|nr:MFS transporter [Allokutzneria albata]SDM54424.1 Predicted arabinose efflux permease, MFS family [Allokutzneria albata]
MTRSRLVLPTYVAAEGLSLFGNSAINVVLPWLVLARTGDASAAAIVAACAGVVQVGATFAIGRLVDLFGARRLAVIADVGSAASVAALALVGIAGGLSLPVMIALAAAGALFDIPGMTARQTLMPRVAERSGVALDTVASVRQGVFGLSLFTGPALAGVLLGVFDPERVLWLTAACSALAALVTLGIRVPPVMGGREAEPGVRGGWRALRWTPVLVKLFSVATVSAGMSAPLLQVLLPAHFAASGRPDLLGFTMSALAVGVIAGSAGYAVLAKVSRRLAWTVAVAATTAGLVLIATLEGFWLVGLGAVVVGVSSGIVSPVFSVVVAERVPAAQLGSVMGMMNAASLVSGPLGLGVAGVVVANGGLPVLAWGVVAVWIVVGLACATGPALRDLEAPQEVSARAHD